MKKEEIRTNRKAEDLTKHIWKKIEKCFEVKDTVWLTDTETLFDAIWYEIEGIYKEHNKEIRTISAEFRRNNHMHEEQKEDLQKQHEVEIKCIMNKNGCMEYCIPLNYMKKVLMKDISVLMMSFKAKIKRWRNDA